MRESIETGKPVGPLHGLPIAIKDTYHMANKATTMGVSLECLFHNGLCSLKGEDQGPKRWTVLGPFFRPKPPHARRTMPKKKTQCYYRLTTLCYLISMLLGPPTYLLQSLAWSRSCALLEQFFIAVPTCHRQACSSKQIITSLAAH